MYEGLIMNKLRRVKLYGDYRKEENKARYGWFHQFSQSSGDDGAYPVAVIELDDGKMVTAWVEVVQFIEPYNDKH